MIQKILDAMIHFLGGVTIKEVEAVRVTILSDAYEQTKNSEIAWLRHEYTELKSITFNKLGITKSETPDTPLPIMEPIVSRKSWLQRKAEFERNEVVRNIPEESIRTEAIWAAKFAKEASKENLG